MDDLVKDTLKAIMNRALKGVIIPILSTLLLQNVFLGIVTSSHLLAFPTVLAWTITVLPSELVCHMTVPFHGSSCNFYTDLFF